MPVPNPCLRHVLPCSTPNPNIVFTADDCVLHTSNGRIQRTDPSHGKTQTLSFEATRNIRSISHAKNRLLTTDEMSRAAVFAPPFLRPYARLTLKSNVITSSISPCAKYAAFLGNTCLEVWHIPQHPVPSFHSWVKCCEFAPGQTSTGCITWSADSRRVSVGLTSGTAIIYTILKERMAGVHMKAVTLYGHRSPIVHLKFIGKFGFISVSEDGAMFCWRLKFHDTDEDNNEPENYQPQEYEFAKDNPYRNPKRKLFIVPVSAKLISKHFVKQGGAKRVTSCDTIDPLLVVGLSNGIFSLYELPDVMTKEDEMIDKGLFEIDDIRREKKKAKLLQKSSTNDDETKENEEDGTDKLIGIGFTKLTLLQTLNVTGGAITRILFNNSGSWIAMSSSFSGQMIIWDWRNETHILKQQGHSLSIESVAFSPDGRAVATGSKDGKLKLWNVHTGFCVVTFSNHESTISSLTFSSNDVILSSSYDGTVRAFDIRRYRNFRIMVAPAPKRKFECVTSDSSGDLVAAGCLDTFEILVWSLRTGSILEILNGHRGPISSLSFRPRRGNLISGSWDKTIRVWDMYERKGNCEVLEHSKEVLDVCYKPNGKDIATCTLSGEIVIWNGDSGTILCTIDGSRDAAGGRSRDSRTVASQKGYFQSIKYSVDGQFIIAGSANSTYICFYYINEQYKTMLVKKVEVTQNKQFDGLLPELNSKFITDSGFAIQEIEDYDEQEENYGKLRRAKQKALPGAKTESELQRKQLIQAQVKCIDVCKTGQLFGAVTGEGVLIYDANNNHNHDDPGNMDILFDPTHLDVDVTQDAVHQSIKEGNIFDALIIALRLNERNLLNTVIEQIDMNQIELIVRQVGFVYFNRLVNLFAWRLEHTKHLEFNLKWSRCMLLQYGKQIKSGGQGQHQMHHDLTAVNSVLRALHRSCMLHSKQITPVADQNQAMLSYLLTISKNRQKTEV